MSNYNVDNDRVIDTISRAKTHLAAVCACLRVAEAIIESADMSTLLEHAKIAKKDSDTLYEKLNLLSDLTELRNQGQS